MSTKQKTPTIADLGGQLEAARQAAEAARASKAGLWARVDAGDATIDGNELQQADIEAERLSRLQKAAAAALNAAIEAQPLPKIPTIAVADDRQGVALLAAQTLLAHNLVRSNVIVGGNMEGLNRADLPVLLLCSGKAADYGQGLLGNTAISLTYIARTTSDLVPDLTAIKTAMRSLGWGLAKDEPAGRTSRAWRTTAESDRISCTASVGLARAWEAVPTMTPHNWHAPLGWNFGDNTHLRLTVDKALGTGLGSTTIDLDLVELGSSVEGDIVTTTVGIRAAVKGDAATTKNTVVARTVRQAWPDLVGSLDTTLGVFTTIEPATGTPTWASNLPAADQAEAEYSYTSTGLGGVNEVGARKSYSLRQNPLGVYYAAATTVRRVNANEVAA